MAYKTGTVTGNRNLYEIIRSFLKNVGYFSEPVYTGTGNGTLQNVTTKSATVTETITIKCTSAVLNGGVFSVIGSVTGALANATVGVDYTSSVINFKIVDGSTDFILNDQWTIDTVVKDGLMAGSPWIEQEYTDTSAGTWTGTKRSWLKHTGLSGTEEIYSGFGCYQSVSSDYYNMSCYMASGFVPGNPYTSQPGYSGAMEIPLWNQSLTYWLVANGMRCICIMKIQTYYMCFYIGKFFPYATPGQYPYPISVGGMVYGETGTRYSTAVNCPWKGNRTNQRSRYIDGSYKNWEVWPISHGGFITPRNTVYSSGVADGYYGLYPFIFHDGSGVYGEIDGLYWLSGFNNSAENTLTVNGENYIVFLDYNRTAVWDYVALKIV